jgi:hypothetical protein
MAVKKKTMRTQKIAQLHYALLGKMTDPAVAILKNNCDVIATPLRQRARADESLAQEQGLTPFNQKVIAIFLPERVTNDARVLRAICRKPIRPFNSSKT